MDKNRDNNGTRPSFWAAAPVETGTLVFLLALLTLARLGDWAPKMNSSVIAVAVFAAWVGLCVIVYRYFYDLDT